MTLAKKLFQHPTDSQTNPDALSESAASLDTMFAVVRALPETIFLTILKEPFQTFVNVGVLRGES